MSRQDKTDQFSVEAYLITEKKIFPKFAQRIAFRIVLSSEQHKDCNYLFKTCRKISGRHLVEIMGDKSNMADGRERSLNVVVNGSS